MVANLHQNPQKRPVVGYRLPTLLRQGCMWLLLNRSTAADDNADTDTDTNLEERWLLPSNTHLNWATGWLWLWSD